MARGGELEVLWTVTARKDIERSCGYIALEDPIAALDTAEVLERAANRLASLPLRGRSVPELAAMGIGGYRELVVSPWHIVYRVRERHVIVCGVIDGRRNVEDLLLERLLEP